MAGHTPGPWEIVAARRDTVGREHIYVCGQHRNSGPVLTVALATGQMLRSREQQCANAHLISAAPDLLEACKEFVRKCDAGEARSTRSYNQMKAAIAKAEGADR